MTLIIVNYHYIDDEHKYQGGIYPVSPERLSNQLDKLGEKFNFIGEKELVAAIKKKENLPGKNCLITFDDGLRSQYEKAMPILEKKKISAVFYINTLPLRYQRSCSVHKIHYLLSKTSPSQLLEKVVSCYEKITGDEFDNIVSKNKEINYKYDTSNDTVILKNTLYNYLDRKLSAQIIDKIFNECYGDEKKFCRGLYLDKEQLREISKNKLFSIGLHTESHINIPSATKDEVRNEISNNYNYLKNDLGIKNIKGISYPFGTIGEEDIDYKIKSCAATLELVYGLTMTRGINTDLDRPLLLKRFDTNDVVGGKKPIMDFNQLFSLK